MFNEILLVIYYSAGGKLEDINKNRHQISTKIDFVYCKFQTQKEISYKRNSNKKNPAGYVVKDIINNVVFRTIHFYQFFIFFIISKGNLWLYCRVLLVNGFY